MTRTTLVILGLFAIGGSEALADSLPRIMVDALCLKKDWSKTNCEFVSLEAGAFPQYDEFESWGLGDSDVSNAIY